MRRTPTLAALAVTVAAVAVPARADAPPTDCYTYLVLAAKDAATGCNTVGVAPVPQNADRRLMEVYVQTGQVSATLLCGGDGSSSEPASATIVVTAPWSGSAYVDRTGFCYLSITALVEGTTAVATNRTARTVD
jgi:hypothetical protein